MRHYPFYSNQHVTIQRRFFATDFRMRRLESDSMNRIENTVGGHVRVTVKILLQLLLREQDHM